MEHRNASYILAFLPERFRTAPQISRPRPPCASVKINGMCPRRHNTAAQKMEDVYVFSLPAFRVPPLHNGWLESARCNDTFAVLLGADGRGSAVTAGVSSTDGTVDALSTSSSSSLARIFVVLFAVVLSISTKVGQIELESGSCSNSHSQIERLQVRELSSSIVGHIDDDTVANDDGG